MTDSVRAAAEKLVQLLDDAAKTPGAPSDDECIAGVEALDNLRTALAQPEPEGELTDEALAAMMPVNLRGDRRALAFARAVEAAVIARRLAPMPAFARAVEAAVIARRLAPVPVSERLPGPGDCALWPGEPDETPWCWAFTKGPIDDDSWERRPFTCLTSKRSMHSHWLPAHALPLPSGEVGVMGETPDQDFPPVTLQITRSCIEKSVTALEIGLEAAIEMHDIVAKANGDRLPHKTHYYAAQMTTIRQALYNLRQESQP